jgi:hypothetical protein
MEAEYAAFMSRVAHALDAKSLHRAAPNGIERHRAVSSGIERYRYDPQLFARRECVCRLQDGGMCEEGLGSENVRADSKSGSMST